MESKKILFFTGHPAQVHNFKSIYFELEKRGHSLHWITTDKDIARYLLDYYNIGYILVKRPKSSFFSKLFTLLHNTFVITKYLKSNDIDIVVSRLSIYMALPCLILRKDLIMLSDTESSGLWGALSAKFGKVLTANTFRRTLRKDQIRFNGNIELFYLHPNRFFSDDKIYNILGLKKKEPYVIMRFVSWEAYHDKGLVGFSDANKITAVKKFSKFARVFISAEKDLPPELESFRIKIPPEKMHDALHHASLFFGESATMASESAVLGTPAIFLNENWFGSTDEESDYGLLYKFKSNTEDQRQSILKGIELLADSHTKAKMKENKEKFLQDKIDVTAFMVWFVENYPNSFSRVLKNSSLQQRFK